MPGLHPPLMAGFLAVFTIMAIVGFIRSVKHRNAFPAIVMILTTLILGFSAIITGTQ